MNRKRHSKFFALAIILSFFLGLVTPALPPVFAQTKTQQDEQATLKAELERLEAEIAEHERIATQYAKEGNTLSTEIKSLDNKIAKLNAQIEYINASLARLNKEIAQNQVSIIRTEDKLDFHRRAISESIQQVYEQENLSLVVILLQSTELSDFFDDLNSIMAVQSGLTANVREITTLKDQLLTEKDNLASKKNDAANLQSIQKSQKIQVSSTKTEKKEVLAITKGQESKYQELATEKKKEAAQIRSRLFKLLGGGEMSFEEAYEIAKYAEDATGVEASFLLATLDRESALGKNVGRCTYKTSMAPGPPDSRRDDVTPFLEITASLGLDPEDTPVSCANADGAYGGAMGPSQFIPTTWILYADKVARITGSSPASPWRNSDAFVATALLMEDNLNACSASGYEGDTQIRCAAARYYAGGNYKLYMYTSYGTGALARKKQFDDDIALITSTLPASGGSSRA